MLKRLFFILPALFCVVWGLSSCEDEETYADRKERERSQINSFLSNGVLVLDDETGDTLLYVKKGINVISESTFYANDSTTNVENNEYVLFSGSGVYMQIVRKGVGKKLEHGESATILMRYTEFNVAADSIQSSNRSITYEPYPEIMTCQNSYGLFTGSFVSGLMMTLYQSASVPSGWLIPMQFVRIGRQIAADDDIALVRLIVPSTEGQSDALSGVYPCFYEISYQKSR